MLGQKLVFLLVQPIFLVQAYYYYDYDYYNREINEPPPLCSDYEMLVINTRQCVRRCNIVCREGVCFEDGPCPCDNHYTTSEINGLVCAAECLPGCNRAGGYCAAPDLCICKNGKKFDAVAQRCRRGGSRLLDTCRGRCTNGRCSPEGLCTCSEGYELRSTHFHGQQCMPQCRQNCGPRAYCFAPNLCACRHKHQHYAFNGVCTEDY